MPEFTIGDSVIYTPSFGLPKPVIVMSSHDGSGYIDVQFVDAGDFADARDMGYLEVVSEMERIARVPQGSLSFSMPTPNIMEPGAEMPHNNVPQMDGGRRRRRPSSRSRRRRTQSRRRAARLSRRH